MAIDVLIWWLIVQVIGVLSLPLTSFLFRTLPDRGYAFSKSVGILLITYGAWLVAMIGIGPFGMPVLLLIAVLVGGFWLVDPSFWLPELDTRERVQTEVASGKNEEQPAPRTSAVQRRWFALRHIFQSQWQTIMLYEVIFLLALLAMVWLRSSNPAPWDSERPMDFAFFNAIQRSESFPPRDPWLSGYPINYYYFGFLMMSTVAMLSQREPVVAYNLALALIYALTAIHISSILSNLMTMTVQHREKPVWAEESIARPNAQTQRPNQEPDSLNTSASEAGMTGILAAGSLPVRTFIMLLGVVLVLLAGNQAGALQVLVGSTRVVALNGGELTTAVGQALANEPQITLDHEVTARVFGTFSTIERGDQIKDFNPWWASRTVWDELIKENRRIESITEFPFFSFWLGDMHPHLMALPFDLLALGLALAMVARPTLPTFGYNRAGWLDLLLCGIILGSLYTINSWDMPTYTGLFFGAMLLLALRLTKPGEQGHWLRLAIQGGLLLVAMAVLFLPFYLTFQSFAGRDDPLTSIPILSYLSKIVAPYKEYHSTRVGLHTFFIVAGLFAIPLGMFLGMQHRACQCTDRLCSWLLVLLVPGLLLIGWLATFPLLVLVGVALLATYLSLRSVQHPVRAFVLLCIALGSLLCVIPDLVYIRDTYYYRLNTIFKFYYQNWLLWGTLAAYALWWVLWLQDDEMPSHSHSRSRVAEYTSLVSTVVGMGLFALFLAGAMVYPLLSIKNILDGGRLMNGPLAGLAPKDFPRGDGLNAPGCPREIFSGEHNAITWLRQHAEPGSIVLEATVQPDFMGNISLSGYSGVSVSTGIPTVLGWYGHEKLWRSGQQDVEAELDTRRADVNRIYETLDPEEARALLTKYNVTFVYIGNLERELYGPANLVKFDAIAEPVFQDGLATVYRFGE